MPGRRPRGRAGMDARRLLGYVTYDERGGDQAFGYEACISTATRIRSLVRSTSSLCLMAVQVLATVL